MIWNIIDCFFFYNVSSICKQTSPCCLHPDMAIYYSRPVSFGLPADFRPRPPWLPSQHTPWFVFVCLNSSFTIQTSTGSLVSMSVDHHLSKDSKLPPLWSAHFIPSLLLTGRVCEWGTTLWQAKFLFCSPLRILRLR